MEKLTPSTARVTPVRVWKEVRRSVTVRSGIAKRFDAAGARKRGNV
jgi:hypothetical protein